MLGPITDEKHQELAQKRQNVSVLLADEISAPITLELPAATELNHIRDLYFQKVSAEEVSSNFRDTWREAFNGELHRLLRRKKDYQESATFLSHLATLSEFSGDLNGCINFLRSGLAVDRTSYSRERLGRTLISLNDFSEAEAVFRNTDLRSDAAANLGLACIEALRGEFRSAFEFVNSALDIDGMNSNALLLAGALELHDENADRAIRFFRSAAEDRSASSAPYLLLAAAYCRSRRTKKAIEVLRRAVAMNPADENAVIFYADALMCEKRYEDAIHAVEEFTKYEQKSAAAWDRVARAAYELGENSRALESLRHQASVSEGSGVWNNIALVHWRMGDNTRALKYLSMAVKASIEEGFSSYLPLYNTFIYFRNIGRLDEALKISELIPAERLPDLVKKHVSSTILALRCEALAEAGKVDQAEEELDRLLAMPAKSRGLYLALLQSATFFYSLVNPNAKKAMQCSELALQEAWNEGTDRERRGALLNNVVFVFLEFGKIEEAEKLLPYISPWVHKSATTTATFGLLHLKKGHLETGRALYEEALSLSSGGIQRRRLKQKMELEIGKFLLAQGNPRGAARHLREAKSASTGLRALESEASELLKTLQ